MEITHRYASWTEFVNDAERRADVNASSHKLRGAGWTLGVDTFAQAVKLAREGWTDGANTVREMVKPISRVVTERTFHTVADFSTKRPGSLNMDRYLMGHPKPFVTTYEVEDHAIGADKIVKIAFNCTASAIVDDAIMMRRGAAVAALVESLERAGRRVEVELIMCVGSHSADDKFEVHATIKRADEPVILENLAYAIAHPATFRRLGFAIEEGEKSDVRRRFGFVTHGGYGSVIEYKPPTGTIYLGGMRGRETDWATPEAAAEWALRQLREQGIETADK